MKPIYWLLVDRLSRMLEPDEREAVCGDFRESGETGGRSLRDLLGLIVRRQAALWMGWRPWLTVVGLVAPLGMLLSLNTRMVAMGSAIPIWMYLNNWTWTYLTNAGARIDFAHNSEDIFKTYLLLICWSWASGFMLGSLSRRTIPVNGALFCLIVLFARLLEAPPNPPSWSERNGNPNAAVFSLAFYRLVFPLILQTVLVLVPAVWGMRHSLRLTTRPAGVRMILWASSFVTVTVLAIRNWGWILCSIGSLRTCVEWTLQVGSSHATGHPESPQITTLPLTLVGPVTYIAATSVWRRWRHWTASV
jgi:hypothetical protein